MMVISIAESPKKVKCDILARLTIGSPNSITIKSKPLSFFGGQSKKYFPANYYPKTFPNTFSRPTEGKRRYQ